MSATGRVLLVLEEPDGMNGFPELETICWCRRLIDSFHKELQIGLG